MQHESEGNALPTYTAAVTPPAKDAICLGITDFETAARYNELAMAWRRHFKRDSPLALVFIPSNSEGWIQASDFLKDGWKDHVIGMKMSIYNLSEYVSLDVAVAGRLSDIVAGIPDGCDGDVLLSFSLENRPASGRFCRGDRETASRLEFIEDVLIVCEVSHREFMAALLVSMRNLRWMDKPVEPKGPAKYSIGLVVPNGPSLSVVDRAVAMPAVDLDLSYGPEILPKHEKVMAFLEDDASSGLVILRGKPGTGKTMYLRNLSRLLHGTRKFVYMPVNMAGHLDGPGLIGFVMKELKERALIIEDAEFLMTARPDGTRPPGMATLLEFGDGFMGDLTNTKIILTINHGDNIDPALLRKGRCVADITFGAPIDADRQRRLAEASGVSIEVAQASANERDGHLVLADFWGNR